MHYKVKQQHKQNKSNQKTIKCSNIKQT